MKKKLILLMIAVCVLPAVASAQSYSIQVTYNTNLRASSSLEARIIETARAGTTLHVEGSRDRWLQINRNGNQVWMASWVGHTRVNGAVSPVNTQPQATTNVDNCCFVDRQCNSDHEWTDGYWAFQNGQCAAPVQAQTLTQSVSVDDGQADNCCFLGWQCNTNDEWASGFHQHRLGQCEHRGVSLEGSEQFKAKMSAGLRLLRDRTPHWYSYTLDGLAKVQEMPGIRIRVTASNGLLRWGTDTGVLRRGRPASIGALLAHEACHVHRGRSGQQIGGVVGETACVQLEIQVLDELGSVPGRRSHLQYLLENIHDPAVQWWNY